MLIYCKIIREIPGIIGNGGCHRANLKLCIDLFDTRAVEKVFLTAKHAKVYAKSQSNIDN